MKKFHNFIASLQF